MLALLVTVWMYSDVTERRVAAIDRNWAEFSSVPSEKGRLLSDLRARVGYGGFIHNFKNYVIRQDPRYAAQALQDVEDAVSMIQRYRSLPVSEEETDALAILDATLVEYRERLALARELVAASLSASSVDAQVKVDDMSAVAAFKTLQAASSAVQQRGAQEVRDAIRGALGSGHNTRILIFIGAISVALVAVVLWRYEIRTRQLREELEYSNACFQGILRNSVDGIITITHDGIIETVNQSGLDMFGYDREELVGKNVSLLIPEQERARHDTYLANADVHASRIIDRPRGLFALRKDKKLLPIELNISPFVMRGEQRFIGIVRDVSTRHDAERSLMKAKLDAETANDAKSRFVANVSHELRTPLNAIIGFAEIIAFEVVGKIGEPKYLDYANDIRDAGHHLMSIISDILDISKIEEGKLELSPDEASLMELVEDALKVTSLTATMKSIRIENRFNAQCDRIFCDRTRIRQVLINIIGNAVKFTPEGGQVQIELTERDDRHLRLAITDTGAGVPAEDIESIFRPFERMSSHIKSAYEGSGLGLPIAKYLVELHNGTLTFTSEVGVGSKVVIDLPRIPDIVG